MSRHPKSAKPRSIPLFPGYPTLASAGLFLCLSGCASYRSPTDDAGGGQSSARGGSSTRGSSGGYAYGPSGGSYGPSYVSSSSRPTNSGGIGGLTGSSGGQGGNDSNGSTSAPDAGADDPRRGDASSADAASPNPDAR